MLRENEAKNKQEQISLQICACNTSFRSVFEMAVVSLQFESIG